MEFVCSVFGFQHIQRVNGTKSHRRILFLFNSWNFVELRHVFLVILFSMFNAKFNHKNEELILVLIVTSYGLNF